VTAFLSNLYLTINGEANLINPVLQPGAEDSNGEKEPVRYFIFRN
jgi:hypothetical protein